MNFLLALPAILAVLLSPIAAPAQNVPTQYPIIASDGEPVANFDLSPELLARLKALIGQIPVGNPNGDVTVMQFYDLNCPYCRAASSDIDALLRADKKLQLIFVPYAVLSVQSVQGAMIELAVAKLLGPQQYLDFHRRLYAGRGRIDGQRALAVAKEIGLDPEKVAALGNTEVTIKTLLQTAKVGGEAQLAATPAYVVGGVAIVGHPGRKPLEKIIASMRRCGKVVCKLDDL